MPFLSLTWVDQVGNQEDRHYELLGELWKLILVLPSHRSGRAWMRSRQFAQWLGRLTQPSPGLAPSEETSALKSAS